MRIQDILKLYEEHPELRELGDRLAHSEKQKFRLKGMVGSQPAFLLTALYHLHKRNTLVILNDKEEALYFHNDLQTLMPQKEILYFPASYKRPYQIEEIDNANVLQRAEVLNQLNHTQSGRLFIVTFAEALCEKIINRRSLVKNTLELRKGEKPGMDFVTEVLEEYRFERSDFVYEPGQFAVRGGILDVYSFGNELPYRIEFLGPEVESIRIFDPVSQLSTEEVTHVSLIPNIQKHLLNEERVHFLEYIPHSTQVFIQNAEFVMADLNRHYERAQKHFEDLHSRSGGAATSSSPEGLYLDGNTFLHQLEQFTVVEFGSRSQFRNPEAELQWEGSPQPQFKKEFSLLAAHLHANAEKNIRTYVCSESEKQFQRLLEIFNEIDPGARFTGIIKELHSGFTDPKLGIALYTDHEIFERYHRYKARASSTRTQALTLRELKELQPGDYVTHVTHGIGQFAGLHTIRVGAAEQEAVKIIYRDGDEIFVNVNSLYKISKYTGKDGTAPKLSKLGSAEWAKAKAKTKKRVKELAFDLIQLYAERKAKHGFAFSPDTYLQQELEASFIYEDTPDQLKSTEDVKRDMEADAPMDRLVCGDVGFGKTEIAIRAAFKAATDGKQSAVLVPTTILALQHFHTFSDRLKKLPVRVDYICRLKSAKEQKQILADLQEGKIDIIIGTHRLVSQDVHFKDLGLLVIDEEQKFGVGVKEKLRRLKVNVDTLTLTATPIPRTMQFSLLGVRDFSVIQTAPPNRQPVETVVHTFDQELIRDAVAYELKRGGQVFFVHNKIEDLPEFGNAVKKLVPDARIAIAHGQMPGEKMEKVMADFIEGSYDVLICTTIIESGLDIPNANTIIINQAQNYGLSDLHQMRGRVGRSNRKAFCYLLAPHESMLSRDARKRLKALEEFSDLGAGFHIALKDLDIRGAGDLLGAEQSGFISEVGAEMYHKILDEAIMEIKEESFADVFKEEIKKRRETFVEDTLVETDQSIMIPGSYIPGISERLLFYNRIAAAESEDELRRISREMLDRFGMVPEQVLGLLDTVRVRWISRSLGFEKVAVSGGVARLYFNSDKKAPFYSSKVFPAIIRYMQMHHQRIKLKESPKYLSLQAQQVETIKDLWFLLQEMQRSVRETIGTLPPQPETNPS